MIDIINLPLSNEEVIKQLKNRNLISCLLESRSISTSVIIGYKEIRLCCFNHRFASLKEGDLNLSFFPRYSYFLKKIGNSDYELYMTYKSGSINLENSKDRVIYVVEVSKDDYENNPLLDWTRAILINNGKEILGTIDIQMKAIHENIENLDPLFDDYTEYLFVRDQARELCNQYSLDKIIEQRDKGDDIELREKGYVKYS